MATRIVDRLGMTISGIVSAFVDRYMHGCEFVDVTYEDAVESHEPLILTISVRRRQGDCHAVESREMRLWIHRDTFSLEHKGEHYEVRIDPWTRAFLVQRERLVYS